jgi:hypothetical protein
VTRSQGEAELDAVRQSTEGHPIHDLKGSLGRDGRVRNGDRIRTTSCKESAFLQIERARVS